MNWNSQTVLVTGAGGFIGSHLTERLVALGARTRAFIRYNSTNSRGWLDTSPLKDDIDYYYGDLRDHRTLRLAVQDADIVFHLGALIAIPYSYQAPVSYIQTNVEGTLGLLQASLDASVRLVVHTSTSEVYGTARSLPITESHPLQAQSPYAASKIGADKIAEAFQLSFGQPIAITRPFNTYGPRQSARAVIPTIITQALTRSEIQLGNIEPTRDFNFVSDTVEGFVRSAECPRAVGQVVNLGSGQEISIQNLASTIVRLMGKDIPITADNERVRPPHSEVARLCADNTKARELLDWSPQSTLKEGLIKTIEWIEKSIEQYRVETYVT